MKYILSSGTSVISDIQRESGVTVSFRTDIDSELAKTFDKYGDAMTAAIGVNNLTGKPIFKVMPIDN